MAKNKQKMAKNGQKWPKIKKNNNFFQNFWSNLEFFDQSHSIQSGLGEINSSRALETDTRAVTG